MPKVLLIEDDQETAQEIVAELESRGFNVDWAATGVEGLDKARVDQADAMVVEVVGARPIGQTSATAGNSSVTSAVPPSELLPRLVTAISGMEKRRV